MYSPQQREDAVQNGHLTASAAYHVAYNGSNIDNRIALENFENRHFELIFLMANFMYNTVVDI